MIGAHDLGGKRGFGRVLQARNPDAIASDSPEPLFHAEWERRAFALTLATGMLGQWNIDESRHARENQEPQRYLDNSYYETWLVGLQKLLHAKGLLEPEELESLPFASSVDVSASLSIYRSSKRMIEPPTPARAAELLAKGGPTLLSDSRQPKYAVGTTVKVLPMTQTGHTRAPQYVHGATGIIYAINGVHIYPDANAHRRDEDKVVGEILYTVSFARAALFPSHALPAVSDGMAPKDKSLHGSPMNHDASTIDKGSVDLGSAKEGSEDRVFVDLWEPYLTHD
ncbi:MAG: nitrile hydratase subunit beta [Pseudomonadales bacterium]|nr:nitrile hydratase subunit beta [Pseudomonadales bacterium]